MPSRETIEQRRQEALITPEQRAAQAANAKTRAELASAVHAVGARLWWATRQVLWLLAFAIGLLFGWWVLLVLFFFIVAKCGAPEEQQSVAEEQLEILKEIRDSL